MVRDSVWGGLPATEFESLVGSDKYSLIMKRVGEWVWGAMRHVVNLEMRFRVESS